MLWPLGAELAASESGCLSEASCILFTAPGSDVLLATSMLSFAATCASETLGVFQVSKTGRMVLVTVVHTAD